MANGFGAVTYAKTAGPQMSLGPSWRASYDKVTITYTNITFTRASSTVQLELKLAYPGLSGSYVIASLGSTGTSIYVPIVSNVTTIVNQSWNASTLTVTATLKVEIPAVLLAGINGHTAVFGTYASNVFTPSAVTNTFSIEAFPYSLPTLTAYEVQRCNIAGAQDDSGAYLKMRATVTSYTMGGAVTNSSLFSWRQVGGGSSENIPFSSGAWSQPFGGGAIALDSKYEVVITTIDTPQIIATGNSASVTVLVPLGPQPLITALTAQRCDADGTQNDLGRFLRVKASWSPEYGTGSFTWDSQGADSSSPVAIENGIWSPPAGARIVPYKPYTIMVYVRDAAGRVNSGAVQLPAIPPIAPPFSEYFGLLSQSISREDGSFETPVQLDIAFIGGVDLNGLFFEFNSFDDSYCDDMSVTFVYADFTSTEYAVRPDSSIYQFNAEENAVYEIHISFHSMNKASRFLWLQSLEFGKVHIFGPDEIVSHNILMDISPVGDDLSIGTLSASLLLADPQSVRFHKRKAIKSYFKNKLLGTYFIDDAERVALNRWNIVASDVVSVLENTWFEGHIYNKGDLVYATDYPGSHADSNPLNRIIYLTGLEISMDEEFYLVRLEGAIHPCTCREALVQIAFSLGAIIDVKENGTILLRKIKTEEVKHIPEGRCMLGLSAKKESSSIGAIILIEHKYAFRYDPPSQNAQPLRETVGAITASSYLGEINRIDFSRPIDIYSISGNGQFEQGAEFLDITAFGMKYKTTPTQQPRTVSGFTYAQTKKFNTKVNQLLADDESAITKTYDRYTLVTEGNTLAPNNVSMLLDLLFEMAMKNQIVSGDVVLEDERLGDMVSVDTEFGVMTGVITSMSIDVNNSKLAGMEIKAS